MYFGTAVLHMCASITYLGLYCIVMHLPSRQRTRAGPGRTYEETVSGFQVGLCAGVPIKLSMFLQRHPTQLFYSGGTGGVCRGYHGLSAGHTGGER